MNVNVQYEINFNFDLNRHGHSILHRRLESVLPNRRNGILHQRWVEKFGITVSRIQLHVLRQAVLVHDDPDNTASLETFLSRII